MVSNITRRAALVGCGTVVLGLAGMRGVYSKGSRVEDSDWPMTRYDAAGTGYNPSVSGPTDGVRVKWRRKPDGFYGASASPVLLGDTVYAVGGGLGLLALDAETGSTRFVHKGSYRSSPARADATAYTTDTLAVTGTAGVFGLNADGGLRMRGIEFGIERWHTASGDTGIVSGPPDAVPPVAVDNTVYAVFPGTAHLTALSASSGRERWRQSPGDELRRPAIHDGTVFAVNWPSQVSAYDAATGTRRWQKSHDEQMVLAPTATDSSVIVPDRTGVTAHNTSDGSERWRFAHDGNATEGAAAVANGRVFVSSGEQDGAFYALDLATGDPLWSTSVGDEGTPAVADGVVYVPSKASSELIALDAATGTVRWRFKTQFFPSTPVVSNNVVYFVAGNRITALEDA
jgi:outer membrane protein assembly factor BamB